MKRLGFLCLAVVGIVGCRADRALPPGPSAEIQDANHGAIRNAFFFWLDPVVNQQPPASQVFSKSLEPTVTITDQGAAGAPSANCHAGTVVRAFTGSAITVSDANYHVNWKTADDNLHAECTYRITVTVGATELGFADVDVVTTGNQLKKVDTQEFIPLLDDRTLPIKFFVGIGSLCRDGADCGEGTAKPGQNSTIITTSGRAGVFIPAGAVSEDVTITIESVDDRTTLGECIPGLPQQFPGTQGTTDNACYDYHAEPVNPGSPDIEQSGPFQFNSPVTVGICPDLVAMDLDHPTLDKIQIFQFDNIGDGITRALDNVPAPFLKCDPHYSPSFGSRRSIFTDLARALGKLITPQPLFASTKAAMFDLGAGGSTDGFSRFTWALPLGDIIDFELFPNGTPACDNCRITDEFSSRGIQFDFETFDHTFTGATLGDGIGTFYGDQANPRNHFVTVPVTESGAGISGYLTMTLTPPYPRTVRFDWSTPPDITPPMNVFPNGSGTPLPPEDIHTTFVRDYTNSAGYPATWRHVEVSNDAGIQRIVFIMTSYVQQIDNVQRVQ